MTIRHLKTFIAVIKCGGITAAAKELRVAQPAVSQTISEMEKYYDVVLFDRIKQRLVITEAGKDLYFKAKDVVECFDEFENLAFNGDYTSTIKIGASVTIGKKFVPKILKNLRENYPTVKPVLKIDKASVIEKELSLGNLDFAIVETSVHSPNILSFEFDRDRLIAISGANYLKKEELTLQELNSCDLLLREKGSASRDYLDSLLALNGLTATPTMESISNQAIISSVIEGQGVSVLPENIVAPYVERGQVKAFKITDEDLDRVAYIITHKNKKLSSIQNSIFVDCKNKRFD
mgnify:CR=1 FL=1